MCGDRSSPFSSNSLPPNPALFGNHFRCPGHSGNAASLPYASKTSTGQGNPVRDPPSEWRAKLAVPQLLCLDCPAFAICSVCIRGWLGTNWWESHCWERWRDDILKANTEMFFQSERAAAATDAGVMDDTGSQAQRGKSVQDERLPAEKTINSRWKLRCPGGEKGAESSQSEKEKLSTK